MEKLICPACEKELTDEVCEHTVYYAANECGVIYVADAYLEQFLVVIEAILRKHGKLEDDEKPSGDEFPNEYIGEFIALFHVEGISHDAYFGVPPSGLAVYAGFVEVS